MCSADPSPSPPVRDIGLFNCGSPGPPYSDVDDSHSTANGVIINLHVHGYSFICLIFWSNSEKSSVLCNINIRVHSGTFQSPADTLDPHSELEGEAPDGSFANRNGRHAIGHVDDFSALQQQVLEGRNLVQRMETTLHTCLSPPLLEGNQRKSEELVRASRPEDHTHNNERQTQRCM